MGAQASAAPQFPSFLLLLLIPSLNMGWVPDHVWYAQKKGKGKGGGGGGVMQVLQSLLGGGGGGGRKGGGKGWRRSGCREKPEKRVWIGNLPAIEDKEKRVEAEKKLKELLQKGGECKYVSISPSGTGIATFPSQEEVVAAVAALAGTKFRGKVLEFDTWEKQEK